MIGQISVHPGDGIEFSRVQIGVRNLHGELFLDGAHQIGKSERIQQSAFKQGFLIVFGGGLSGDFLYQLPQALAAARIGHVTIVP